MSSIEDIRRSRGVPAKRGMVVRYYGSGKVQLGRIVSARNGYLRILLDGDRFPKSFHSTWKLDYLDNFGEVIYRSETRRSGFS